MLFHEWALSLPVAVHAQTIIADSTACYEENVLNGLVTEAHLTKNEIGSIAKRTISIW